MNESMTPTEMTLLIGTKYLPLAEITDPVILPAAQDIKGDGGSLGLGAHVVMAGLLALREEGAISLRYVETKKMRVFTSRHVMVARTGECSYTTCEGGLFKAVGSGQAQSAKHVVGTWFGPQVEDPGTQAYLSTWNRLVSLGLIVMEHEEIERGKVGSVLTGKKTKTQAVARANTALITDALPQLARWSKRWTEFRTDEAELATRLFNEIKRTLESKKKSDADADDSD